MYVRLEVHTTQSNPLEALGPDMDSYCTRCASTGMLGGKRYGRVGSDRVDSDMTSSGKARMDPSQGLSFSKTCRRYSMVLVNVLLVSEATFYVPVLHIVLI